MKEGPLLLHVPNVPEHVTYAWFAMAVLIGLAIATRMTLKKAAPTGLQNIFETIFGGLDNYIEEIMGPQGKTYFPLIGSLFLFILVCNLLGLIPGFDSPTANLNTTAALAITVFSATHIVGIKKQGLSYFKHFLGPIWWLSWLMLPIEIISHLARPVSLSFRLFGNMVAKHKLLVALMALSVFTPTFFVLGLGLFVAFVQAGVFSLLTMLYLAGAIEESHGEEHH
ncbi:MAG TPA: F0F1 ATP synthase subunit A [Nitrospirota bacterium]